MDDRVRAGEGRPPDLRIADIAAEEFEPGSPPRSQQGRDAAVQQGVQHPHRRATGQELVDHERADVAGPSRHDRPWS